MGAWRASSLLTAPWYVAIGLASHGEFYRVAVGYHIIQRMTTGIEEHGGFPGYYLVTCAGDLLSRGRPCCRRPWSGPGRGAGAIPPSGSCWAGSVGPLDPAGMRADEADPLLPAGLPGLRLLVAWLVVTLAEAEVTSRRWPLGRLSLGLLAGIGVGQVVGLLAGALVLPAGMRWPCLALAVVLAAGTLRRGRAVPARGDRAGGGRPGGDLGPDAAPAAGAWLLPAAEPYRLSGIVGRRLAALSASEKARPVLATFKPPGVVYTLGRPAPLIRDLPGLLEQIDGEGAVVAASSPRRSAASGPTRGCGRTSGRPSAASTWRRPGARRCKWSSSAAKGRPWRDDPRRAASSDRPMTDRRQRQESHHRLSLSSFVRLESWPRSATMSSTSFSGTYQFMAAVDEHSKTTVVRIPRLWTS